MIKNILNIFKNNSSENVLSEMIKKIHLIIPQDFGGGCSHKKALLMSLVISEFKLDKTADIGVYKGRSFFPQAIAHQLYSGGVVYGIDPYSSEEAVQNDRPDLQKELDDFVAMTDFQKLYDDVSDIIINYGYSSNSKLIRSTSCNAAVEFKRAEIKFGLVHIDGNHDTKLVMEDVQNYFPLLAEKSFMVLDDISWNSVQPAYSLLRKEMLFIDEFVNEYNDFALFGKGLTVSEINKLKKTFKKIKP